MSYLVFKSGDGEHCNPALIADLMARGAQNAGTNATSCLNCKSLNILMCAEEQNKKKYKPACEYWHISLTPLVTSVDGVLRHELTFKLKLIADEMSAKRDQT